MNLLALANARLSKARAIVRLVSATAMPVSPEIVALIEALDVEGVKAYIKKHRPLEEKTFDELRLLGAVRKISNYSRMDRETLIKALKEADNELGFAISETASDHTNAGDNQ